MIVTFFGMDRRAIAGPAAVAREGWEAAALMRSAMRLGPIALLALVAACAHAPVSREQLSNEQRLQQSQQILAENPTDKNARIQFVNDRYRRINELFDQARQAAASGDVAQARTLLQTVLQLDGNNTRAKENLKQLDTNVRHGEKIDEARAMSDTNPEGARAILHQVLAEAPGNPEARNLLRVIDDKLNSVSLAPRKLKLRKPGTISLEFRDANLRNIFEVISKISGVNIVLDPGVRSDLTASIFVKDASVESAIDFLLMIHQLSKKVLTDNSLLIYPASKAGQYDDMILRSFYLNYADVTRTSGMIKTMLPIRDVFVDEKLNMFSVRATYDQLASIEKMVANQDLPDPEVLLEVEVLEVKRTHLSEVGIAFPDTLSVLATDKGGGTDASGNATPGTLTWRDIQTANGTRIGVSPGLAVKLLRQDGDNNLLANPRVRVKNREKAKILIGDKIPILTTTIAALSNFASRSANYLDVGLKLDVEPRVMLNNEVSIRLSLEVSNASFSSSSEFPTIGTRNISTMLVSGDGETQVLAGLINDEDRKTIQKLPGLGSIPLLGRLFSDPRDDRAKTEIVLLITPHVVRNFQRPDAADVEFYSGTGGQNGPLNVNPAAAFQQLPSSMPQQLPAPAGESGVPAAPQTGAAATPATPVAPAVPAPAPASPASPTTPATGNMDSSQPLQQLGKPPGSE